MNIRIPVIGAVGENQPSDRKLRKTFDFHFVAKGETLYAISRQYEIPVNTIIEDNPGIDPTHLRLGERILIRRRQIGSENEAGSLQQWEEYRQSLNSVADAGTAYPHRTPGRDLLFALAPLRDHRGRTGGAQRRTEGRRPQGRGHDQGPGQRTDGTRRHGRLARRGG